MTNYRSLNHTKWACQYHVVFIPKYRKKVIYTAAPVLRSSELGAGSTFTLANTPGFQGA